MRFKLDIRSAGIAPIMQQHAETPRGNLARKRDKLLIAAPATGNQRNPGARITDNFIIDIKSTHHRYSHLFTLVIEKT